MIKIEVASIIAPIPAHSKWRAIGPARLLLTLFCFSFASPAFAFSQRTDLEELIIAAAGSVLFSLIAMIVIFIKSEKSFLPRLLMSLASPLLVFPVCMAGSMATSYIVKQASDMKKVQDLAQQAQAESAAWQNNPLRINACGGDSATLKIELASDVHDDATRLRVLDECILPRADAVSLQVMLLDRLARNTEQWAYCTYLDRVMQRMNTSLLDVFVEQKLALACPSDIYSAAGDGTTVEPSWWDLVNQQRNGDTAQLLKTLRYLQAHGVNMKVAVDGRSLLSMAMESSKPTLILFALDAGADPYLHAEETSTLSPLEIWTLQRFYFVEMGTYTDADRQSIQARLRDMTGKEADALAHKLSNRGGLDHAKDGGAGLLAYLIKSGASLRSMNRGGNGAFSAYTRLSPALLEVINKLNDQQLLEFICPEPGQNNDVYSVYAEAINIDNKEMISFLKQRNMPKTCPAIQK
ncbi:MAG: hypothetical protein WA071_22565 [Undibacterium umbellatum]|uniref:hypothetical protein n=1 Tax=Undibacterium umbellatum TaxID=2762300 RepID=UPI003BB62DB0